MPRKVSYLEAKEQPIHWSRAIVWGAVSAVFMSAFVNTFYMLGITPFSYENYLGTLLSGYPYSGHNWMLGFFSNLVAGSLFGLFYGYFFEFVFRRSGAKVGIQIGFWHALAAAVAFFPFIDALHQFTETGFYPRGPGILGSGLGGASTVIIVVTGHFLYGASMGVLYHAVRRERVRERYFEPGPLLPEGDPDRITPDEDPEDRSAA